MTLAADPSEITALEHRYLAAMQSASAAGVETIAADFEQATATHSRVAISRDSTEVFRLACGDNQLYTTYYNLIEAGYRVPSSSKWDALRPIIDSKAFPYFSKHIRYGALTLDQAGLLHYGDAHLLLKTPMIDFRTTVFTENTAVFVKEHDLSIPPGHRATWENRGKLAVAKLATYLTTSASEGDFPHILKKNGASADTDSFIEAHIYGSISIRTVEQVTISVAARPSVRIRALREKLQKLNVRLVKA